jgi:CHAD domain-containing protein
MDIGYRSLSALYIRRQAKQLADQLDGVRAAEDIEFVHRARVATRRLRAAFRMFGDAIARKRIRRWRKATRRVTSALGDARDRDVQIDCLCRILGGLTDKACFVGIAHVLVQLERDRERLQRRVAKAVERLRDKGVLGEMRRATGKTLRRLEASPKSLPTPGALAEARKHIVARLAAVRERQQSLASFEDRAGHHALRIAVKRLRYTMEICRPLYGGRLDRLVEAVKPLQTLLGEIHDCDVWLDHLDEFASAQQERIAAMFGHTARFSRLKPGIDFLQADRRARRQRTFEELVSYWAELCRQGVWDELAAIAEAPAPERAESQPPPPVAEAGNVGEPAPPVADQVADQVLDQSGPVGGQNPAGGNGHAKPNGARLVSDATAVQ